MTDVIKILEENKEHLLPRKVIEGGLVCSWRGLKF